MKKAFAGLFFAASTLIPFILHAQAPFDWTVPPPKNPKGEIFTQAEREAFFPAPTFDPDTSGIEMSRLHPVPAPGMHPRVYITPADLPEIRKRIKTSKAARIAYQKLCKETEDFFYEGTEKEVQEVSVIHEKPELGVFEDESGDIGLDLEEKESTYFEKSTVQALADGTANVGLLNGGKTADGTRIGITRMLAANGLRALIDDDGKRGKRAAVALAHYGTLCVEQMEAGKGIGAYRPVHYLTLAYDYTAPFMTEEQKAPVRKAIAMGLTDPFRYLDGAMYGVGHPRPSHNWMSLVSQYIMCFAMVIEGEETGIDGIGPEYAAQAVKTIADSATRWVHYFYDDSGASYEGLGKSQLNVFHYVALARRGNLLLFHPHVRRYLDSWLPSLMQPWGYAITVHSGWGSSYKHIRPSEVLPMKFLAPDDRRIDFLYRNAVRDDYSEIDALDVIYAMDFKGPDDWEDHAGWAGLDTAHISKGRAMLNARSAWEKDAAWLQFVCDQQYTAHMQNEIGNFMFSSHGRLWAHFISANDSVGASSYHSVMLIDGIQQHGIGRMVSARANEIAAFATADWAPVYNGYVTAPDVYPSINDYHPLAPLEAPFSDSRNTGFSWRDPWTKTTVSEDWRAKPALELEHAYRTVGLVRGPRRYVLIMDDVRPKDGLTHSFDWYMQVPNDVVVARIENKNIKGFEFKDLILAGEADTSPPANAFGHRGVKKGAPVLLVRLLRANVDKGRHSPMPGVLETYNNVPSWPNTPLRPVGKRIKIQTWAKNPDCLVMLYPHRMGEEPPKTTWLGKNKLQVTFDNQLDLFTFSKTEDGKPAFRLEQAAGIGRGDKRFSLGLKMDELDAVLENNEDKGLLDDL